MLRVAVVRFPGSNSDDDALRAAERVGAASYFVWHRDTDLRQADVVILPGGFSYGDYLRAGAIARFSPIMEAVGRHAAAGGAVLGICNGFQILCEAQLLPGALMKNSGLTYVSRPVVVRVEQTATPFTRGFTRGQLLRLPIAHGDGRYVADPQTLRELEDTGRIVLRYAGEEAASPNGAMHDIAGLCNAGGNVVGIMPHPERANDAILGNDDGAGFFEAMAAEGALAGTGNTTSRPEASAR
jgi:phosphoribosylformylglycinamidine synthase subunit PurQ / glutaminase